MSSVILSYGVAFPALRLPATAYLQAWGQCAAPGLKQKAFCSYDEDAITLGIAAARAALQDGLAIDRLGAIFVGATTLPFEEKPSSASILTALTHRRGIEVIEVRGSPQAGLQALALAADYCAARPGVLALAIASDAPSAPADAPYEHALGAGAAAFLVGPGDEEGIAAIGLRRAVSIESFGARFRRRGQAHLNDLELRSRDDQVALEALTAGGDLPKPKYLAMGAPPRSAATVAKRLGGEADDIWTTLGDAGSASAPLALARCLDLAAAGETIMAVAFGSGLYALAVERNHHPARSSEFDSRLASGKTVDYLSYLRQRRMLSSRFGETG